MDIIVEYRLYMAKDRREKFNMVCQNCGEYNYSITNVRTNDPVEHNKYCPRCNQHTPHKQKKIPSGR